MRTAKRYSRNPEQVRFYLRLCKRGIRKSQACHRGGTRFLAEQDRAVRRALGRPGKAGTPVALGVPVAVVEDHDQVMLGHEIMWTGTDVQVAVPLIKAGKEYVPQVTLCSVDRGFHRLSNRVALDALLVHHVLPKKGYLNREDRARAHAPVFRAARKQHPGVASCLTNVGLRGGDLVREKSPEDVAIMVGLSVLAVPVHRLGCILRNRIRKRIRSAA